MAVNPRHTPRPASTGTVARHGPESWPGMLRNWWPAWTGIRSNNCFCNTDGHKMMGRRPPIEDGIEGLAFSITEMLFGEATAIDAPENVYVDDVQLEVNDFDADTRL